jgi:hypothetical protein
MNLNFILTLTLSPVISAVTSVFIQWLTGRTNRRAKIDQMRMQRIEKLYAPFYMICLKGFAPENDIWNRRTAVAEIVNLLINNVTFMSSQTQKLFKAYYSSYSNRFFKSPPTSQDKENYNECFKSLAKSMQADYTLLCKQLRLEPPLQLF